MAKPCPCDRDSLGGGIENQPGTRAARLTCALNNHFEGLILFTITYVVVTLAQKSGTFTTTCACHCLIARIANGPAYAFGRTQWRSYIRLVWCAATPLMLIAALL